MRIRRLRSLTESNKEWGLSSLVDDEFRGTFTIGRDTNCEIRIDSNGKRRTKGSIEDDRAIKDPAATVSREHAEIQYSHDLNPEDPSIKGVFYITDLVSTNGTRLNGNLIMPNRIFKLCSGDILDFGSYRTIFEDKDIGPYKG
jgi:pSer/pThr/pTyr-binding forkhead associated (FHA) protein